MLLLLVMAAVFVMALVFLKGVIALAIGALIYRFLASDGPAAEVVISVPGSPELPGRT